MAHQPNARSGSEGQGAPLSGTPATIAAVATPAGRGGIGVVRISGPAASRIAQTMLGAIPEPRKALLKDFRAADGALIDRGLALFFPAPHSYTGEDVLELQGHGGPMVMLQLVRECVAAGARLAEPGEFTRRAFLNDRLDLAQAESVADLIDAASVEAARGAASSLAGTFSARVHEIVAALVELRMHVEACIDFPEEEIDPADRDAQRMKLESIVARLHALRDETRQGALLRDGLSVVLIGRPNVGKSSLLNRLAGDEVAIVTPIPGTTRDYVRATLSLDGVPIHLVDTAGLREATDEVERVGVERTWRAVEHAGAAIFITEAGASGDAAAEAAHLQRLPRRLPIARLVNKIDLSGETAGWADSASGRYLRVSAKTGAGIDSLRQWLLETAGWKPAAEGTFIARERHLNAIDRASEHLRTAMAAFQAIELLAEHLRLAQNSLSSITGEFGADDLLGEIFSRFCIGK